MSTKQAITWRKRWGWAEFGQDLGRADATGAREGHEDGTVGKRRGGMFQARGQLGDLGNQGGENDGEAAHELATDLGFGLTSLSGRRSAQAGEQLGGARRPQ